jgi:hypothetical protein
MQRVVFHGTRAELKALTYRLGAILAGREADTLGVARGFLLSLGVAALSDIKDAFVTKARGGTDEMGIKWPPLSKEYLAYGRRFGRGEKVKLTRAAGLDLKLNRFAPGGDKGLLTKDQLIRWRKIFASLVPRFYMSTGNIAFAKTRAAQIAWATLKKEGAKTKLEVFGSRPAEILRDTGILLNSLSPGIVGGTPGPSASYEKPGLPGGEDQIFELGRGQVAVGTTVAYAGAHNKPIKATVPRRQFLPDNAEQVPEVWWDRWLTVGVQALANGAATYFGRRGAA